MPLGCGAILDCERREFRLALLGDASRRLALLAALPEARNPSYTAPNEGHVRAVTHPHTERFGRGGPHAREPLSRTEGLLILMFVTFSAAILGAGTLGYTSLSGQLLEMQQQIGSLRTEMRDEIGQLSERMARIETVLQIHHGPLPGP